VFLVGLFRSVSSQEVKLVGGEDLDEVKYPWYAVTAGPLLCGGSLIHEDIIISAAHCEAAIRDGFLLGGIDLDGSDQNRHAVSEMLPHPDFAGGPSPNDILLAKLETPSDITPIRYASDERNPREGTTVRVVGYGSIREDGPNSWIMQEITTTVSSIDACWNYYGNYINRDLMVCTLSSDNPPVDTCQGKTFNLSRSLCSFSFLPNSELLRFFAYR